MEQVWCEVDVDALAENVRLFRRLVGAESRLAVAVKGNAYGHGAVLAARTFLGAGADWLCVHGISEARVLRAAGLSAPILVLGPVAVAELAEAAALDLRLTVYNTETIEALAASGRPARLHLKIETGNHRQGVALDEALAIADRIARTPALVLEGVSSHFANIEDTTDHRYARHQLARFEEVVTALRARGHTVPMRHLSNSAAALLWPDQTFEMVRVGVSAYGLWPSRETRLAAALVGRGTLSLRPALTWKTRVGQIKEVPEGAYIGYGCTYRTSHPTRLAVLPVGYFDGYDRRLSNLAYVLIRGRRAPVRGRVCMNIAMVEVTDVHDARLDDEVVLLGRQGEEEIAAEVMAGWAGTINYEIVTRVAGHVPRIAEPGSGPAAAPVAAAWRPPRT